MKGYGNLCSPELPEGCLQNAEGKSETDPILQDTPPLSTHIKMLILRVLILHFQFSPTTETYFLREKKIKTRGKPSGIKVHLRICWPHANRWTVQREAGHKI